MGDEGRLELEMKVSNLLNQIEDYEQDKIRLEDANLKLEERALDLQFEKEHFDLQYARM